MYRSYPPNSLYTGPNVLVVVTELVVIRTCLLLLLGKLVASVNQCIAHSSLTRSKQDPVIACIKQTRCKQHPLYCSQQPNSF